MLNCKICADRYGGQFAFVEVINSMQQPRHFPGIVSFSTAIMGIGYVGIGMIGYWYAALSPRTHPFITLT